MTSRSAMNGSLPEIQRLDAGGIPLFWAETPEPAVGGLLFRVGRADESLPAGGITHLVEHLALSALGPRQYEYNGSVGVTWTSFHASGSMEEVISFLTEVAANLAHLPLGRLSREARILATEAANRTPGWLDHLFALRFGPTRFGLVAYPEHGLLWLDETAVGAWAAERFTRGNAVAWFVGPEVPRLDLSLPEGERVAVPEPPDLKLPLPSAVRRNTNHVSMSMVAKREMPLTLALRIAVPRLQQRLRYELGLTYDTSGSYMPLTSDLASAAIWADIAEGKANAVVAALLDTLDRLAAEGPSPEELARESSAARRRIADAMTIRLYTSADATNELIGAPVLTNAELLAEMEAATPESCAAALRAALDAALVLMPASTTVPLGGLKEFPEWSDSVVKGKAYSVAGSAKQRLPATARLIAGAEGISLAFDAKRVVTVRFADCVGVTWTRAGVRTLFSADSSNVQVSPFDWNGGPEIVRLVDRSVPADRFVPDPGATSVSRRSVTAPPLARRGASYDSG